MKTNKKNVTKTALTILALFFFFSCSKDEEQDKVQPGGIQVVANSRFGNILTDTEGKTLYFFSNDTKATSTCKGNCLATWPVYYSSQTSTDLKLDKNLIGEITREDGAKQSTFKGWPLYYYAGDSQVGQVNGDAMNKIWYVAKPDYLLMIANGQLIGHDGKNYLGDYSEGIGPTSYLTDDKGRTLYAFKPDKFNKNTYTASDFSNDALWPIFQNETGSLPSLLRTDDMAVINVFGRKQLTYKGWPLYYFGQDQQRGDNKGVSFPKPGIWPVLNNTTTTAPTN
ncbi:COG4315 family predicted lipoprotein [Sphingobacterium thalpophilum]|uniref:COG4315 family predicted lipoprotein n=1 Tax=Sphingobacterium thalpophilum TaxID=259 RepID=UPI003DA5673E